MTRIFHRSLQKDGWMQTSSCQAPAHIIVCDLLCIEMFQNLGCEIPIAHEIRRQTLLYRQVLRLIIWHLNDSVRLKIIKCILVLWDIFVRFQNLSFLCL